ncbi:hypothetical protein HG537_0C00560 [Torulaspora globosa]|uniref:Putative ER transporter 6TM N-terminal domain-containing protein n=1 Tax=Torulaspora globosa TaxID=48254 RepID=A0A7H9HQ50_9SACH|nr:hypothetical protein HG537_0C00560 [Torulaspora sp. CBS 2947]
MDSKSSRPSNMGISKGSYQQTSYLSLRDLNKSAGVTSRDSNLSSPQLSRVNLSCLRLESAAKVRKWKELDDFNLEELRDGFFDPVFTKPERFQVDDDEDNEMCHLVSVSARLKDFNCFQSIKSLIMEINREKIRIFKYFTAFFVSLVICVIHPSGKWVGHQHRYFLPVAVLLHHPVRNVGVQLEISLTSTLGGALGMGWSALAWYISVATRPTASHQGGILFASLTLALLWAIWMRELYQRLLYVTMSFCIAIVFLHDVSLVSSRQDLQWRVFWDFGISYLFGILLSLIVCALVDPHSGNAELVEHYNDSIINTKQFLLALIDKEISGQDKLTALQKKMVNSISVGLSEGYREFANQWTISKFNRNKLKELRNSLTSFVSPLRVLPISHKLLDRTELVKLYEQLSNTKNDNSVSKNAQMSATPEVETPMVHSGSVTPSPRSPGALPKGITLNSELYLSVLRSSFSRDTFALILEMVSALESTAETLHKFEKTKLTFKNLDELNGMLQRSSHRLKRKIYKLDVCYKNFTKSDFFCKELLGDADCIDIFLFIRYLRKAAKHLTIVIEKCESLGSDIRWRITPLHYPLSRALIRLPKQCGLDEGAGNVLHYFETKRDVDRTFECLYNSYTSRHKYTKGENENKTGVSVRAIDHNDFNFHTTKNKWRFRLWKLSTALVGPEMKWSLKITFVVIFFSLPGWIPESYLWYDRYQCWWAPLTFLLLAHRKLSAKWRTLGQRLGCALVGISWGWAANQSRHFGNPYVICTFGGLLAILFASNIFVFGNTKSSFTALLCFIVIVLEPYGKGSPSLNTADIWKNTWVTGLSLIIAVLTSIPINWIVWSFRARSELRLSLSSLLSHLGQSYQSVTDRYLYRDLNDAPTELTLALSHIREIRLTQSTLAVRDLLTKAKNEMSFTSCISNFSPIKYERLLNACDFLLEKIIEARISGTFFEIWNQDPDNETTRALLSLRRDSVSSVIFVFYILSNCFRSKNKVPLYLPNPMLSRKKLYDFLSEFQQRRTQIHQSKHNEHLSLEKRIIQTHAAAYQSESYEKSHWTEIHGMAFARAFTDVTEALQIVVACSKDILGEEIP